MLHIIQVHHVVGRCIECQVHFHWMLSLSSLLASLLTTAVKSSVRGHWYELRGWVCYSQILLLFFIYGHDLIVVILTVGNVCKMPHEHNLEQEQRAILMITGVENFSCKRSLKDAGSNYLENLVKCCDGLC